MVLNEISSKRLRPFLVASIATMVAVIGAMVAAPGWASADTGVTGGTGGTAPTPPDTEVPAGQLVRRGLSGEVVGLVDGGFKVGTRFGEVVVLVNSQTRIKMPPHGEAELADVVVGARVGVLLLKPGDDNASPSGEPGVIRTATAGHVMIVPSKATREHHRAVILEKIKDALKNRVKIVNENGDELEVESDVEIENEEGEEILLITVRDRTAGLRIKAAAAAERIENRLAQLASKRVEIEAQLQKVRERYNAERGKLLDLVKDRVKDKQLGDKVRDRIAEARDQAAKRVDEARKRVQLRLDEARTRTQDRVDEARTRAQDRVDDARTRAQDRVDEARTRAQDRVDDAQRELTDRLQDALDNSDRLTDEQRRQLQEQLEKARKEAEERLLENRGRADEQLDRARGRAEEEIEEARERAEDELAQARERAQKEIENARSRVDEQLERARELARERLERAGGQQDDDDAGDRDGDAGSRADGALDSVAP